MSSCVALLSFFLHRLKRTFYLWRPENRFQMHGRDDIELSKGGNVAPADMFNGCSIGCRHSVVFELKWHCNALETFWHLFTSDHGNPLGRFFSTNLNFTTEPTDFGENMMNFQWRLQFLFHHSMTHLQGSPCPVGSTFLAIIIFNHQCERKR
jgi:hypothetical protein